MRMGTIGWAAIAVAGAFIASNANSADATSSAARSAVLTQYTIKGQPVPCVAESDGVRVCHADGKAPDSPDLRIKSFDGTPLEAYITLPPAPSSGSDGNYPFVILSHGWGAPPSGPDDKQYGGPSARDWAKLGYATVQLAARGWGNSCGNLPSRFLNPGGCANAYVRRADFRYEIRDAQYVAGLLVDEGIADRNRIGAQGESYGGGTSLALATLNDRVMNIDGTLSPWTSRVGKPFTSPPPRLSPFGATGPRCRRTGIGSIPRLPGQSCLALWRTEDVGQSGTVHGRAGGCYLPPPLAEPDMMMGFAIITAGEPYDRPD